MTTGQRMKLRRKEIGLSAEKVAELLGVSPATIYRYENGDIDKVPGDKLGPIAKALKTTPAYLMGWDEKQSTTFDIFSIPGIMPVPKTKKIPLLGEIACGTPILAADNIEDYIDLPETAQQADFCLRCKGDSMINARIYDGDIVFVRQQPTVENGEIAAVIIDGEATLKRFYRHGDTVMLVAENPAYPPMSITLDEYSDIRIAGKAVAFLSYI